MGLVHGSHVVYPSYFSHCAHVYPSYFSHSAHQYLAAQGIEADPNVILKDLDLDMKLQLDPASHNLLMSQLKADCSLLR